MPIVNPIIQIASGLSRTTAKLMKTGQTTSYRTGDDGDIEAGRDTDFFTLAENTPFGNTNRFTDELGGQTYTNDIVIDWSTYDGSTVLGWRRTDNGSNINWSNAIDSALLLSIGGFSSGWRLSNNNEFSSIKYAGALNNNPLNYAPFNLSVAWRYWTATIPQSDRAINHINNPTFESRTDGITSNVGYRYIPVRNFTVTGTTLT